MERSVTARREKGCSRTVRRESSVLYTGQERKREKGVLQWFGGRGVSYDGE